MTIVDSALCAILCFNDFPREIGEKSFYVFSLYGVSFIVCHFDGQKPVKLKSNKTNNVEGNLSTRPEPSFMNKTFIDGVFVI